MIPAETSVKLCYKPEAALSKSGTTEAPLSSVPLISSAVVFPPTPSTVYTFPMMNSVCSDGAQTEYPIISTDLCESNCEENPEAQAAQFKTVAKEAPLSPFPIKSCSVFQSSYESTEVLSQMVSSIDSGKDQADSTVHCAARLQSECEVLPHTRSAPAVAFIQEAQDSLSEPSPTSAPSSPPCAPAVSQSNDGAMSARVSSMPFDPGIRPFPS